MTVQVSGILQFVNEFPGCMHLGDLPVCLTSPRVVVIRNEPSCVMSYSGKTLLVYNIVVDKGLCKMQVDTQLLAILLNI